MRGLFWSMGRGITLLLLFMVFVSCTPAGEAPGVFVVWSVGDVSVVRGGAQPKQIALKESLVPGDRLQTGKDSFAVVQLDTKVVIRLQEESILDMTKINDQKNTEVFLGKGQVLSRVTKLGKGESYGVRMPTALAAVRGTEFSATFREGEKRVSVKSGTVDVTVKGAGEAAAPGEKKAVSGGTTLEFDGELKARPIDSKESLQIELVSIVPVLPDPGKADEIFLKNRNEELQKKQKAVEEKMNESAAPPTTIEGILAQYRRIDEIVLYNGKVIRGVILQRGAAYKVLTPGGTITVPNSQIRNTRLVQSR